jgi:hypothetical protein
MPSQVMGTQMNAEILGWKKLTLGGNVQIIARKGGIMGLGMRIFIVKDNGLLERLAFEKYNRLLQRHPSDRLFQYAGKRVRCAVIVVKSINRKPVEILKCQYSYLSFDSDGMLKRGGEGEVKLAMDMLEPVIIERAKQVVDARHKFARKLYAREYRWEPSHEIEASIHKAIFG